MAEVVSVKRQPMYWVASIAIAIAFVATIAGLDVFGKRSRVVGDAFALDQENLPIMTVDRSVDAYGIWKERGVHGRVVVALGRRLNFEWPESTNLIPREISKIKSFSLSSMMESRLDIRNFLYLALEAGYAREMIHVLPETVYAGKAAAIQGSAEVQVTELGIQTTVLGSPRTLTSLKAFRPPGEPVLLYVDASYFKDQDPLDVIAELRARNLRTDGVILSRARDDEEVTAREREKMKLFESRLGG